MSRTLLNIGCGDRKLPGFVNIDREPGADLQLDVTRGLPFANESVQGIFSEHFIEHLSQAETFAFLRECRRVLAPSGVLRIATPDLDTMIARYSSAEWKKQAWIKNFGYDWFDNRCEMFNYAMRSWGHQWVYNEEELTRIATFTGLAFKHRWPVGESDVLEFQGIEYRDDSFIVEFVKDRHLNTPNPLVSILVPAYNPRFLRESLQSAVAQMYRNLEIIVVDDSPGDDVGRIVSEFSRTDSRIMYVKNERNLGAYENYLKAFSLSRGDYIKFLNDDDALHPLCVQRMAECLCERADVTLVTSHRQMIDERGRPLPDTPATARPVNRDSQLNGVAVVDTMLSHRVNFVGEPTTTMFRRRDISDIRPNILTLGGRPVKANTDVGMWVNLLSKGDLFYYVDSLSSFRQHSEQAQAQSWVVELCRSAWSQIVEDAMRLGFLGRYRFANQASADLTTNKTVPTSSTRIPPVSIIISTCNRWEYTVKCLEKVVEHAKGIRFELILVDNGSTDGTREALNGLSSTCRVHLNEADLGLAKARNQGAQMAHGKYLLFLDSTTEPQPGWLEAMVKAIEADPSIAVVRSKLLFPNGTIQHGGDAATEQRKLRAMTVACMLVRKEIFHSVGGFDEGYQNGYEDIDLCLKIREAGGRIVDAPESIVICHVTVAEGGHIGELPNREEVFDPGVESIVLTDPRPTRYLLIPDWENPDWRRVMTEYLRRYTATDPVSLIVRVEPPLPDQVNRAIEQIDSLVKELDLKGESWADIVLETSTIPPKRRGGLYTAATALLACAGSQEDLYIREAKACGLPILDRLPEPDVPPATASA